MFLIDENLPKSLCKLLQEFGFEARWMKSQEDTDIWRLAKSTASIIITEDSDFVDMSIFDRSVKVVFVATGNILNHDLLALFREREADIREFMTESRQVLDIV